MKLYLHNFDRGAAVQQDEEMVCMDNEDQKNLVQITFMPEDGTEAVSCCVSVNDLKAVVAAIATYNEPNQGGNATI